MDVTPVVFLNPRDALTFFLHIIYKYDHEKDVHVVAGMWIGLSSVSLQEF